jgi:hypothetical protein
MSKNKKTPETDPDLSDSAKYIWRENIMKILILDANMINQFKANALDAYQSFALVFIALPASLLSIYLQYDQTPFAQKGIDFQLFGLVYFLCFLMHHATYYLILARIAESFERWPGFLKYIQIRNLLVTMMIVAEVIIIIGVTLFSFSDALHLTLSFLLGIYGIFLQYFIIRQSFNASVGFTIGLILLDNIIALLTTIGILSLVFPTAAAS